MSHTPHEVVERWLTALNARDTEAVLALSAPHVRLVGPRGTAEGHAVLRQWLAHAGAAFTTRAVYARDAAVVVAQHGVWRDATGAVVGEAEVATRFEVAAHQVVALQRHDALPAALQAAGLTEADACRPDTGGRAS